MLDGQSTIWPSEHIIRYIKTYKQTNSKMYIYTNLHSITKNMENNVVSKKLKAYQSLMSSGTFVIYNVHPMCSDEHIKIVILFIKI